MVYAIEDPLDRTVLRLSQPDPFPAQGGILGNESHLEFANETLHAGDVAYFPNQRAYWFREATGKIPAETINVSGWSFQVLLPSGNETWLGRKSPVNGHLDGNIRTKWGVVHQAMLDY